MSAAVELMCLYDLEQISVEQICEKADIVRSTFYQHFKSIEDLIAEHFQLIEQLTPERVAWILDAPTAYEKAVRVHLAYIEESSAPKRIALYKINLKSYLSNASADNLYRSSDMERMLLPLIIQAQQANEIRNKSDAEMLCRTATTIHWGNLMKWTMSNAAFDRVTVITQELETLYDVREDLRMSRYLP